MSALLFGSLFELAYSALLIAAAFASYLMRRRRLLGAAGVLFLPLIPAAAWLASADSTIALPETGAGTQLLLVGATSFFSVWAGVAAGFLFDSVNAAGGSSTYKE